MSKLLDLLGCTWVDMHCYKRRLDYPFEEDLESQRLLKNLKDQQCRRLAYSSIKKQMDR